jgi:hypothetical protein
MGTHAAPTGQPPALGPGRQMSAHCEGDAEPGVSSTHSPLAVAPLWVSAGHGEVGPHLGEQNEPASQGRFIITQATTFVNTCAGVSRQTRSTPIKGTRCKQKGYLKKISHYFLWGILVKEGGEGRGLQ